MIHGAHILFYSGEPAADRAFIRDRLGFPLPSGAEIGLYQPTHTTAPSESART